jgi:hypothetical protein
MDAEEIALESFGLNVVLRQHGQRFAPAQFSGPSAADTRGPAEEHTFGHRYDHNQLQFDFLWGVRTRGHLDQRWALSPKILFSASGRAE